MNNSTITLIGAGGHAKVIMQILASLPYTILGFIDDKVEQFFNIPKLEEQHLFVDNRNAAIGFGGVSVTELKRRWQVFTDYQKRNIYFPSLISATAVLAQEVKLAKGVTVCPAAIINANVVLEEACIINTGAIIEHDVVIGAGSHVAPGAIVLGGANIGKNCMIGAGAVILPGAKLADESLVASLTRYAGQTHAN